MKVAFAILRVLFDCHNNVDGVANRIDRDYNQAWIKL